MRWGVLVVVNMWFRIDLNRTNPIPRPGQKKLIRWEPYSSFPLTFSCLPLIWFSNIPVWKQKNTMSNTERSQTKSRAKIFLTKQTNRETEQVNLLALAYFWLKTIGHHIFLFFLATNLINIFLLGQWTRMIRARGLHRFLKCS